MDTSGIMAAMEFDLDRSLVAVADAMHRLDPRAVDELPGRVFEVAVDAGWIKPPRPPQSEGLLLGQYRVAKTFHAAFAGRLQLHSIARRSRGTSPTPANLLADFKALTAWSDERIAQEVRKEYGKDTADNREPISVKTIRRMREAGHQTKPDILQALAAVMRKARPNNSPFNVMHWQWLRWRPLPAYRKTLEAAVED